MTQADPAPADVLAEPILDVRDLTKRYPNGQLALDRVTVQVWPGEFVVVLGANGSGKSTLLRCAARLIDPTGGAVRLGGVDLAQLHGRRLREARRRIGLMLQSPSLVRRRGGLDNVAAGSLGRHRDVASHLGRSPRSEHGLAARCPHEVGLTAEHLALQRQSSVGRSAER